MFVNKSDMKNLSEPIRRKAERILQDMSNAKQKMLNIDRDIRVISLNDQFRLIFRYSTQKECRVVTHNVYNKLITNRCINNII